jgi:hypothetical protein
MAKRGRKGRVNRLENFAKSLGTLLGSAEAKVRALARQRDEAAAELHAVKAHADSLLKELSGGARREIRQAGRRLKKARKVSAATRAKMRAAAHRRWSNLRKAAKTARKAAKQAVS